MGQLVQLEVPDHLMKLAQEIAEDTNGTLESVLSDWLYQGVTGGPIEWLPDDQVLTLTDMKMEKHLQEEMSDLLYQQSAEEISDKQRDRLEQLLNIYRHGTVIKSHALVIAVKRGLRPRLDAVQA